MISPNRFCRRHPDVEGRLLVLSSMLLDVETYECPSCVREIEQAIWEGMIATHIAPGGEERKLKGAHT